LMSVPPFRLFGFGAEFRRVNQNTLCLSAFIVSLTFRFVVCAV
jgi:hypothetical protein